jgi:hypothetical protein
VENIHAPDLRIRFFIVNFHVLGLFIPKKQVEGVKNSVCHAALSALPSGRWTKFEIYRIEISLTFIIWAELMHLILRILKSFEKTLESKKFINLFEIFVIRLDGSNFGERCLLESSILNFQNF